MKKQYYKPKADSVEYDRFEYNLLDSIKIADKFHDEFQKFSPNLVAAFDYERKSIFRDHKVIYENKSSEKNIDKKYKSKNVVYANSSRFSMTNAKVTQRKDMKYINVNLHNHPEYVEELLNLKAMFGTFSPADRYLRETVNGKVVEKPQSRSDMKKTHKDLKKIAKVLNNWKIKGERVIETLYVEEMANKRTKKGKKDVENIGLHSHWISSYNPDKAIVQMKWFYRYSQPNKVINRGNIHTTLKTLIDILIKSLNIKGLIRLTKQRSNSLISADRKHLSKDSQEVLKYIAKGSDVLLWSNRLMAEALTVFQGTNIKLRSSNGIWRKLLAKPSEEEMLKVYSDSENDWHSIGNIFKNKKENEFATTTLQEQKIDTFENFIRLYKAPTKEVIETTVDYNNDYYNDLIPVEYYNHDEHKYFDKKFNIKTYERMISEKWSEEDIHNSDLYKCYILEQMAMLQSIEYNDNLIKIYNDNNLQDSETIYVSYGHYDRSIGKMRDELYFTDIEKRLSKKTLKEYNDELYNRRRKSSAAILSQVDWGLWDQEITSTHTLDWS